MSQRIIRDQSKSAEDETRPERLLVAAEPRQSSETESASASGTPRQVVMDLRDQRAVPAVNRERLALTLRELVADLATSRRECRGKQQEIDSLKAEIVRLVAASSPSVKQDNQAFAGPPREGQGHEPEPRPRPRQHTTDRMSIAVLVLRRGHFALTEENASLRLELARPHATDSRRAGVTSAEDRDGNGRTD